MMKFVTSSSRSSKATPTTTHHPTPSPSRNVISSTSNNLELRHPKEVTQDNSIADPNPRNGSFRPNHEEYEKFIEMLMVENKLLNEEKELIRLRRQRYIDELCKQHLITSQLIKNHHIRCYTNDTK
ncbi:unnamed protein product [Anisakis simplex]|uniref:Uncharacterized protein n=1 Tax=Anisakis simplex TaxID=6269 RepID=A0A0M3JW57_ANISI|nr:unnamed protein product [Anisakis simplex]